MKFLSKLSRVTLKNKTVLLRVDLNIDLRDMRYPFRLDAVISTIKLLARGAKKVIILSHRGRPEGIQKEFSLHIFQKLLQKKLNRRVSFVPYSDSWDKIKSTLERSPSNIILLENLRFWKGEEENGTRFAKQLASLGDLFVNDAFAVCHRKNASVVAITKFLPSYAGLQFESELKNLGGALRNPKRPLTVILGGAKVADKVGVIKHLWQKTDSFLLGGGPLNTYLLAHRVWVGDSVMDRAFLPYMKKISHTGKVIEPIDFKAKENRIEDIGRKTLAEYKKVIMHSKTVIWSGPMGEYEKKSFASGTTGVARAIAQSKAVSIAGGGSVTSLITKLGLQRKFTFISTGGGAMLEYLSGKKLPGIEVLK